MPGFKEPTKSQEPILAVAELQRASPNIPLSTFPGPNASHRLLRPPTESTRTVGCQHEQRPQSKPKSAGRSTRPKRHASNDTHGCSQGANSHAFNQPKKKKKMTQRGRHRPQKGSSPVQPPPRSKSGNTRPPLPPDYVLTRQGDTLHRELDRVLKNGRMMFWQEHIFTGAFGKIRGALLELGSRDEKGAPITETEYHARAYAREAFDRFKMCMERV